MLSNVYLLAKFRFDTAESEPAKNLQKLATFASFADPNPEPPNVGAGPLRRRRCRRAQGVVRGLQLPAEGEARRRRRSRRPAGCGPCKE